MFDLVWVNLFEDVPNNPDRRHDQKNRQEAEEDQFKNGFKTESGHTLDESGSQKLVV